MEKVLTVLGGVAVFALFLFMLPILGFLGGIFSGWVVGWFFSETVLSFFAMIGVKGLAMWQIGGALGFVGGFFKSANFNKD